MVNAYDKNEYRTRKEGPFVMNPVFSREMLRSIPEQNRQMAINILINNQYHMSIINAATAGSLTCILDLGPYLERLSRKTPQSLEYVPTIEDIVEGLKQKYPGCLVTYAEDWVETTPGVRQLKKHILVDWS